MHWNRETGDEVDEKIHRNNGFQKRQNNLKEKRDDTNERFGSSEVEEGSEGELATDWLDSANNASQNLSSIRPEDWAERHEQKLEPTDSTYEVNESNDSSSADYRSAEAELGKKLLHKFINFGK